MYQQAAEALSCRAMWLALPLTWVRLFGMALLRICPLAIAGCSMLLDVDSDQCVVDADCTASGLGGLCAQGVCVATNAATCVGPTCPVGAASGAGDAVVCSGVVCPEADALCFDSQCASAEVVAPFMCAPTAAATTEMVTVELQVEEFVRRNEALAGLHVTACLAMDVFCDAPVGRAADPMLTGNLRLEVPRGFDGYLNIESDTTMPFVFEFTHPVVAPIVGRSVRVGSYKTIEQLTTVTKAPVDLEQGIIIIEAYGCQGVAQGGIHFSEATGEALPFYLVNVLPNLEATVTVFDENAGYAVGGFFNVPPGLVLVTATAGVGGPMISTHNAHVRSGAMTFIDIRR